ncbi:MAG: hypothetical protein H0W86_08650 [Armatimonadetes bacterium]|nr:hypothetical protein [Armatimonadota bacterium]
MRPSAHISVGVQGVGTGNPGWTGRLEKNFRTEAGNLNVFGGIGLRSNEDHAHPVAGTKLEMPSHISLGLQWDGHNAHPFATYGLDRYIVGFYLIGGKTLGYLFGARF